MNEHFPPPIPPEDQLHDADGCFWGAMLAAFIWIAILGIGLWWLFEGRPL